MKNKTVTKFTSRMVVGCIVSILLGKWLDEQFSTTPWIMFALLIYSIGGSFYLLIKETGEDPDGR
ncbi:AtpZ/AtpI family protein [Merdibacter massiliensis]|uniref:AtpZ/AtpI family protein n=1 Tax=Merdibacter massiliensis TaxID=1871030 RepID=UPI00096A2553|nr:AtpZ/AtpI family protein [Merdibacter massiliensis]